MRISVPLALHVVRPGDARRTAVTLRHDVEIAETSSASAPVAARLVRGDGNVLEWRSGPDGLYMKGCHRFSHERRDTPAPELAMTEFGGACRLTAPSYDRAWQERFSRRTTFEDATTADRDSVEGRRAVDASDAAARLYLMVDGVVWERHPGPVMVLDEGNLKVMTGLPHPGYGQAYATTVASNVDDALRDVRAGGLDAPYADGRVEIADRSLVARFDALSYAVEQVLQRALKRLGEETLAKADPGLMRAYARARSAAREEGPWTGRPTTSTLSSYDERLFERPWRDGAHDLVDDLARGLGARLTRRERAGLEFLAGRCRERSALLAVDAADMESIAGIRA